MSTAADAVLCLWFPTDAEAAALAALDHSGYGDRSLSVRQWRQLLRSRAVVVLAVGRTPEQPIGVVAVRLSADRVANVLRLTVAAEARREGVGRLLVEVLGEAHRLRLQLRERSTEALAFARAVGFRAVGLSRERFGDCDGIDLERPATTVVVDRG